MLNQALNLANYLLFLRCSFLLIKKQLVTLFNLCLDHLYAADGVICHILFLYNRLRLSTLSKLLLTCLFAYVLDSRRLLLAVLLLWFDKFGL